NIQLIIHTVTATSSRATPAAESSVWVSPAVETRACPRTIRTTPATAIARGSHSRVADRSSRPTLPPSSGIPAPRYIERTQLLRLLRVGWCEDAGPPRTSWEALHDGRNDSTDVATRGRGRRGGAGGRTAPGVGTA